MWSTMKMLTTGVPILADAGPGSVEAASNGWGKVGQARGSLLPPVTAIRDMYIRVWIWAWSQIAVWI